MPFDGQSGPFGLALSNVAIGLGPAQPPIGFCHQPVCIAPFRCIARTGHGAIAAKGEFDELVGRAQRAGAALRRDAAEGRL